MNKWAQLGVHVAGLVIPGVAQVDVLSKVIPGLKGKAKQDAVVELVRSAVIASESIADKDLLNDAEIETATRAVIDAVVAFQNVIARKHAA